MFYILLLCCTALVTMAVDLAATATQMPGPSFDLCGTKTLRLGTAGDSGYITFDNTSLSTGVNNGLGCVLKIESCSFCQIELKPSTESYFQFFCKTGNDHNKYCSLGCDYLNIFDMYYMNETNRYYRSLGLTQNVFRSESSNVFIMLCHGGIASKYDFKIHFSTIKKMKTITGSSETSSATGFINSPYFPYGYAQNHEVYEYLISSTDADDYIRLMFDDWHLSETSSLYFINSNKHGQFNGGSNRPVVISDNSQLKFSFSTGVSLTAGENRDFLGFRATYKFFKDRRFISKPNTNCRGQSYLMSSKGGKISFSPGSPTRELYDCLWVVKTQDGFDGTYLKIIRFGTNGYGFRGDNLIRIHNGISSLANVRAEYDMLDNINHGVPHLSSTGFYIRLNATMTSSDSVLLTYASYKNAPGCGSNLFVCSNNRCIDRGLMCDGYDHCGDNSDEVSGCADNTGPWDKSYQYTITIGVIVPMVISVFLIMVICLLFVMIRRCRRARLREVRESSERLPTVSEDVSGRRRRRRHRRRLGFLGSSERDRPPTYDEAIQNPPGWYLNVAFGNPVDPSLPQPPSYHEAVGADPSDTNANHQQAPGSPVSTDSSQSELTVCSGNISDSSSSSDEGSAWGTYNGDGDGRRGRLGRHVSSSESGTSTLERGPQSTTSPEQTESILPSVTAAENSHNRDVAVEESQNVGNTAKEDKDNTCIAGKALEKKLNEETDNFVVPSGPKPGCSEPHITDCRPMVYSSVTSQGPESCSLIGPSNHGRNISSGSETTTETVKKPKKKTRKSRSKKTSSQPVCSSDIPESVASDLNFSEYLISQAPSNVPHIHSHIHEIPNAVQLQQLPKPHDLNNQHRQPGQTTTEHSAGRSPQTTANPDLAYQVIVNVDNDAVLVVYDSAENRCERMSPSHVSKMDEFPVNGNTDLASRNTARALDATATDFNAGSGHTKERRKRNAADDINRGADGRNVLADGILGNKNSAKHDVNCDQRVISLKESNSYLSEGALDNNKQLNQPSISLRHDLCDTDDIYV